MHQRQRHQSCGGREQGGSNTRGKGYSPVGSSQKQAQESCRIHAPGQERGGQTPGTELQDSIPQNPWEKEESQA